MKWFAANLAAIRRFGIQIRFAIILARGHPHKLVTRSANCSAEGRRARPDVLRSVVTPA